MSISKKSKPQPVSRQYVIKLRKAVKSVASAIQGFWSTTIRNLMRGISTSLALLLMGIVGRLVHYVAKSESVESSAQTATENTQLSNKDIIGKTKFKENSESLPHALSLTYDDPHKFLRDVVKGELALSNVTLEQWLIASSYAMIDKEIEDLEMALVVGGQVFSVHHCIQAVYFPNPVKPLMENKH